jgi:hypothetical protein
VYNSNKRNIFCLPRTPVQDRIIQNSIQSIITDFRIYFACCRNSVTTEFGLEVASLYFWLWNCISKHREREKFQNYLHSVQFLSCFMKKADQMLAHCLLLSWVRVRNWHHLKPRFVINRRYSIFSILTVWALSVARKDFKVEHHPLLPRISLVLIALQISD